MGHLLVERFFLGLNTRRVVSVDKFAFDAV